MAISFSIVALAMWLGGYLASVGSVLSEQTPFGSARGSVRPPTWLYYLCGAPRCASRPGGMLSSRGFMWQTAGLIFAAFTFAMAMWRPIYNLFPAGLLGSILTAYVAVSILRGRSRSH